MIIDGRGQISTNRQIENACTARAPKQEIHLNITANMCAYIYREREMKSYILVKMNASYGSWEALGGSKCSTARCGNDLSTFLRNLLF